MMPRNWDRIRPARTTSDDRQSSSVLFSDASHCSSVMNIELRDIISARCQARLGYMTNNNVNVWYKLVLFDGCMR